MTGFDTNILIYSCDMRDPEKQQHAKLLLKDTLDGVILWQVACEFMAASRKLASQSFAIDQAWAALNELFDMFPLITPGEPVYVMHQARELHLQAGWSFWDSVLVAACLDAGVTRLFTEDLPGGPAPDGLEIINPFA